MVSKFAQFCMTQSTIARYSELASDHPIITIHGPSGRQHYPRGESPGDSAVITHCETISVLDCVFPTRCEMMHPAQRKSAPIH